MLIGFPSYYFPYDNSEGYLSPLVAIHFIKPKRKILIIISLEIHFNWKFIFLQGGVIINVECRAWAHNIKYDRKERTGCVRFQLLID